MRATALMLALDRKTFEEAKGDTAEDDQPPPSKKTLSGYHLSPAIPGRNGMSAVHTSDACVSLLELLERFT